MILQITEATFAIVARARLEHELEGLSPTELLIARISYEPSLATTVGEVAKYFIPGMNAAKLAELLEAHEASYDAMVAEVTTQHNGTFTDAQIGTAIVNWAISIVNAETANQAT